MHAVYSITFLSQVPLSTTPLTCRRCRFTSCYCDRFSLLDPGCLLSNLLQLKEHSVPSAASLSTCPREWPLRSRKWCHFPVCLQEAGWADWGPLSSRCPSQWHLTHVNSGPAGGAMEPGERGGGVGTLRQWWKWWVASQLLVSLPHESGQLALLQYTHSQPLYQTGVCKYRTHLQHCKNLNPQQILGICILMHPSQSWWSKAAAEATLW